MLKKTVIIIFVTVALITVAGCIVFSFQNQKSVDEVKSFKISDYVSKISQQQKSAVTYGTISTAKAAKKAAQTVWIKVFGKSVIKEKPYIVYYDKNYSAWLVTGSLPDNSKDETAHIILSKDEGKVLAVWHEK